MSDVTRILKEAAIQIGSGGSAGKPRGLVGPFNELSARRLRGGVHNAPPRPREDEAADPVGEGCESQRPALLFRHMGLLPENVQARGDYVLLERYHPSYSGGDTEKGCESNAAPCMMLAPYF